MTNLFRRTENQPLYDWAAQVLVSILAIAAIMPGIIAYGLFVRYAPEYDNGNIIPETIVAVPLMWASTLFTEAVLRLSIRSASTLVDHDLSRLENVVGLAVRAVGFTAGGSLDAITNSNDDVLNNAGLVRLESLDDELATRVKIAQDAD